MVEQPQQPTGSVPLSTVVADIASEVALALRGGGDPYALPVILRPHGDAAALAAIRVLGADVLAPLALTVHTAAPTARVTTATAAAASPSTAADPHAGPPAGSDTTVTDPLTVPDADGSRAVLQALAAYRPGPDASEVSVWSYRGLADAAHAFLPAVHGALVPLPDAGLAWTATDPWPALAHRAAQLAALSLPGLASPLPGKLADRTDDLARGFVRAVRRRDWLQAAGLGRWLARLPQVPDTLGLDAGLVFVRRMGGADARVVLHVEAAQRFHGRGR